MAGELGILLGPGAGEARAAAGGRDQGKGRQRPEFVLIQDDIITRFFP
jgi:hypothetical protein